ncbi:MAG TPA: ABC transporter permease subunit, partial [Gammaproteobacteria bacterium]|nr:ABC transporter permease subunit [Gammaproteobacteria bacterium]
GFGPVVGLIASAIYACPPMVRNTLLALQRVPTEIVESGEMAGATPRQLFWWVRFPIALPTIMIGVNQATMAALSMVIIAAIIGSSADIGWEVLSTMRRANFGESLLAGIVVALIAMLLDRITRALAVHDAKDGWGSSRLTARTVITATILVAVLIVTAAAFYPGINTYPDKWTFYPVTPINNAITFVTIEFSVTLESIKNTTLFFFLLPMRIGFENTIRPFTWGFELTPVITAGYAVVGAALALLLGVRYTWRAAVGAVLVLTLLFFGLEKLPWPLMILVLVVLSWQVGGTKVGLLTLFGLSFMVFTGVWQLAMRSLYLCLAAVLVSFVVGGLLGIWASQNYRVSRTLRPINDTLQTMPLFVLLIPVLMFFQIGEFTAFLAIIAYAIVPAIRYTEHGLRHVDPAVIEAAEAIGCKRYQLLWQVRLPLAIPEIMLGLNQTIMFALAMLVIAALVGTQGLGQAVYIALARADFGLGLVAGLSMALIAIIADRVLQAFSRERKRALGLD